jgi:hypothetical protein
VFSRYVVDVCYVDAFFKLFFISGLRGSLRFHVRRA